MSIVDRIKQRGMGTYDELAELEASHERLRVALQEMVDNFQYTDECPGQGDAVRKADAALAAIPEVKS